MKRPFQKLLFSAVVAVGIAPTHAWAHPHEFVTMKIGIAFDDAGKIAGMRYNWTFDEFFSAYALEGQDNNKNGKVEREEMDAVLTEVIGNIKRIQYFTKFEAEGLTPIFDDATPLSSEMVGRKLSLTFEVPFKASFDVKNTPLKYATYDPEFYISFEHDKDKKAVTLVNAPKNCGTQLSEPTPSEDIEEFASSLGKDDSGGPDLGSSFAEWVTISCK